RGSKSDARRLHSGTTSLTADRISLLYLERDRAGGVEELRRVIGGFAMPAPYLLADGRQRAAATTGLHIFYEDIFYRDVVRPILAELGISWAEFRQRDPARKSSPVGEGR